MTYQRDQQITDKIKAMQGDQDTVKWARELIGKLNEISARGEAGLITISDPDTLKLINDLEGKGVVINFPTKWTVSGDVGARATIILDAPPKSGTAQTDIDANKKSNQDQLKLLTDSLDTEIKSKGTSLEMQNLELQQLMSRRTQGIEISTQIQSKLEKAKDSVIRNV